MMRAGTTLLFTALLFTALVFTAVLLGGTAMPARAQTPEKGFHGSFEFRWLADPAGQHRKMKLVSDVSFVDGKGIEWRVPAGTDIDGASIPGYLWSFEGSPFVGNYRRASVIHDYFCDTVVTGPEPVHTMFWEAMIADGVSTFEAGKKHFAVSAYSYAGGKCGKPKPPEFDLKGLKFSSRIGDTDKLINMLGANEAILGMGLPSETQMQAQIVEEGDIRFPQTYMAITRHLDDPSQDTLDGVGKAMQAENPTPDDIAALTAVAAASRNAAQRIFPRQ